MTNLHTGSDEMIGPFTSFDATVLTRSLMSGFLTKRQNQHYNHALKALHKLNELYGNTYVEINGSISYGTKLNSVECYVICIMHKTHC